MGKEMRREARRRELEAKVFGHWSPSFAFCFHDLIPQILYVQFLVRTLACCTLLGFI